MTAEQMHRRIQLRVQKVDSNAFDSLLPGEVDEYINHAISRFIKDRFEPMSNSFGKGFEQSQKRFDDLRTLVKKNQSQDTTQVSANAAVGSFFVDRASFPNDYYFGISLRFNIHYNDEGLTFTLSTGKRIPDGSQGTDYENKTVSGKLSQSDDIYRLLGDPFNTTDINGPIFDYNDSGIDVYTDDRFIVDKVLFNYIKEPTIVLVDENTPSNNVDSDLPEQTHPEIVDMASKLILVDIGAFGPQGQFSSLQDVE